MHCVRRTGVNVFSGLCRKLVTKGSRGGLTPLVVAPVGCKTRFAPTMVGIPLEYQHYSPSLSPAQRCATGKEPLAAKPSWVHVIGHTHTGERLSASPRRQRLKSSMHFSGRVR